MDMLPPEVKDALPGVGGSITALFFFRRGWPMAIALFVCGFVASMYLGPTAAKIMGTSGEVGGYVTGCFSMAIISKIFDTIAAFDGKRLATNIRKRMGG